MGSLVNSKHLGKKIISILYGPFQKIEAEQILLNSFYDATVTLIPKPDTDIRRK